MFLLLIKNPCPERESGFLSRILFAWFDSLVWIGYRKPLTKDNLWSMNPEDTSTEVVPVFEKYWEQAVAKAKK